MDAVAFEPQFVDHLAPVWHALAPAVRGRFITASDLVGRAQSLGIEADGRSVADARFGPPPAAQPGTGPAALVSSIGDMKIGRRYGYRRFVRLEHGYGQAYPYSRVPNHPSYPGGDDNEDVVLFLPPNEYAAARWRARYPATPVVVVGCPKLDTLPGREGDGPFTVAITFHWDLNLCPETHPAGEFIGALGALRREFTLIGTQHPRWADTGDHLAGYYDRVGIEMVRSFDEVCRRADLLVFDNTSAGYEFASTGRPVVVMNSRTYRRDVAHGLRFWSAAGVGPNADADASPATTARNLIAAIERAISGLPGDFEARQQALSEVYTLRTQAARRAANVIEGWASEAAA